MTATFYSMRMPDVSDGTGVLYLPRAELVPTSRPAAVAWLTRDTEGSERTALQKQALAHCVARVQEQLDGPELWLLTGHSAWQEPTRITRYYGLWKRLERSGVVPAGALTLEACLESTKGLRYFGAAQLPPEATDPAVSLWEDQGTTHLVALPPGGRQLIETLVEEGWDAATYAPSPMIVNAVTGLRGVVFWPIGVFDDPEDGCAVVGLPELIEKLVL